MSGSTSSGGTVEHNGKPEAYSAAESSTVSESDVEGINRPNVTKWFEANVEAIEPPLTFELIAGGRSNLTYRVTDESGGSWALRRPPVSHVLPTAHDMVREYTVMSALGPSAVPVPRTIGLCRDVDVNDSPFYVMEFVEGSILRDAASAEAVLDEKGRRTAGESIANTLAALHAVDIDEVGLGDFAKRTGYIERQLRRWKSQFDASTVEGLDTTSIIGAVHQKLESHIPEQLGTAIVHGDYRLDNTVLGPDGSVRAVLDWEICTLGDALADVGLLMVYWTDPGDEASLAGVAPTALTGFPTRAELRQIYAKASGRDLSELPFYEGFGYWKLACILQGVLARYAGGAKAGDRSGVEGFAEGIVHLGNLALGSLENL